MNVYSEWSTFLDNFSIHFFIQISTNVTHPQAQVENVEAMLSVAILLEDSLALANPGSQEIRLSTAMVSAETKIPKFLSMYSTMRAMQTFFKDKNSEEM